MQPGAFIVRRDLNRTPHHGLDHAQANCGVADVLADAGRAQACLGPANKRREILASVSVRLFNQLLPIGNKYGLYATPWGTELARGVVGRGRPLDSYAKDNSDRVIIRACSA